MSRSLRFRYGLHHPSQRLCLELARTRSHVSLKRRQGYRHCLHAPKITYRTLSRSSGSGQEDYGHGDEAPQPFQGRLKAIPKVRSFVSTFEEAVITTSKERGRHDAAQPNKPITAPKLSRPITNAGDVQHCGKDLGSWVIIPDELVSRNGSPDSIASGGGREDAEAGPRTLVLERPGLSSQTSARERSLLALTLDYTRHVHHLLAARENSLGLLKCIESVFTSQRLRKLEIRSFQVEDVVRWGWILAAETADKAVRRLHMLATLPTHSSDVSPMTDMPFFILTIVLRSRTLSGSSLTMLVEILLVRLQRPKAAVLTRPDSTTCMILLARLMRHARRVAPRQLIAIADLTGTLLQVDYPSKPSSWKLMQRLTSNYNRVLSLLSVPLPQHPFLHVSIQQQAQLKIIRQMASHDPALPVTREGYQAMVKVQVSHKKTPAEQDWARTKADSWPPWRIDKLGISEDLEYSGSHSRAAEVLRRQIEAGYTETKWDQTAKVLAGWDTDKSPTIQTRVLLSKAPLTWLNSITQALVKPGGDKQKATMADAGLWSARIRATRTVREAWSCFFAYESASNVGQRTQEPYQAMFEKLAGRLQATDVGNDLSHYLPGDGREVFDQPVSSKSHLHIPEEPPDFHAFFDRMQLDGVKPGGRLLAQLLDYARTPEEGIKYLEASKLSESRKDVMLNAHKYDANFIRSTFMFVQPFVVSSFLRMIWRTRRSSGNTWFRPTSYAVEAGDLGEGPKPVRAEHISAHAYVLDLITQIHISAPIGNRLLGTIAVDLKTKTGRLSLSDGWRALQVVLECMLASNTKPDTATFYAVASAIETIIDANPGFTFGLTHASQQEQMRYGCEIAKKLFIDVVVEPAAKVLVHPKETSTGLLFRPETGPTSKKAYLDRTAADQAAVQIGWLPCSADSKILEVPTPAALHLLMRLLTKSGERRTILRLLRWIDRFTTELTKVRNEVANGKRQMRFALCVAAMAVEEEVGTSRSDMAEEIHVVRKLIDRNVILGGWPTDGELEKYLQKGRPSDRHKE